MSCKSNSLASVARNQSCLKCQLHFFLHIFNSGLAKTTFFFYRKKNYWTFWLFFFLLNTWFLWASVNVCGIKRKNQSYCAKVCIKFFFISEEIVDLVNISVRLFKDQETVKFYLDFKIIKLYSRNRRLRRRFPHPGWS